MNLCAVHFDWKNKTPPASIRNVGGARGHHGLSPPHYRSSDDLLIVASQSSI